jgi:hypothetical protein
MTSRASIFEPDDDDIDVVGFKPAAAPRPRDPKAVAAVRETAEARGFVSREASAPQAPPTSAPQSSPMAPETIPQEARVRRRRTGRDKQLNLKVTEACLNQLYAVADAHGWGLGETFERALAALEAELNGGSK